MCAKDGDDHDSAVSHGGASLAELCVIASRDSQAIFFDPASLGIYAGDAALVHLHATGGDAPLQTAALNSVSLPTLRADTGSSPEAPLPQAQDAVRPRLRRLTLNIANTCNLACRYCYAGGGDYALSPTLMSGGRAAELIGEALRLWDVETLMFFGGEPSLNPDAIAETCLLVTELHNSGLITSLPRFAVISNLAGQGEAFDQFLGLCKLLDIHITASIDGPAQVHDANRVDRAGRGSYARVRDNYSRARDLGIDLGIECTYTEQHLAQGISVIELMDFFDQEFDQQQTHIAPVMQNGSKAESTIALCAQFCNALQYSLETLNRDRALSISLGQRILLALAAQEPIAHYCPAGRAELAIGPDGLVYPCFMFTGVKHFQMGAMDAEHWPFPQVSHILSEISAADKDSHPLCRACWARGLCSGCVGGDYYATGSLSTKPQCALPQSMAAEAIVRLAELGQGKPLGYFGYAHRLNAL